MVISMSDLEIAFIAAKDDDDFQRGTPPEKPHYVHAYQRGELTTVCDIEVAGPEWRTPGDPWTSGRSGYLPCPDCRARLAEH
jgi:hypothetical protein